MPIYLTRTLLIQQGKFQKQRPNLAQVQTGRQISDYRIGSYYQRLRLLSKGITIGAMLANEFSLKNISSLSTMENLVLRDQCHTYSQLNKSSLNRHNRRGKEVFQSRSPQAVQNNKRTKFLGSETLNMTEMVSHEHLGRTNNFNDQIQYYARQVQILRERIQAKALKQQQQIEGQYNQLKHLQFQFTNRLKQQLSSAVSAEKQLIKTISVKIKQLFSELKIKAAQNSKLSTQQRKTFDTQISEVKDSIVMKQQNQREKQWEKQIDQMGKLMVGLENDIYLIKEETKQKFKTFQKSLWLMESEFTEMMDKERSLTQDEHELILKLINKATEHMLLL